MKQLVSILIPAFNAEKWISACIESAISQTWPQKEIIVVDDGSTDGTLSLAESYSSSSIQVVAQKNLGASAARNHALSLAQGDYIQWLDADDLLASDKIKIQLEDAEPGHLSRILLSGAWGRFFHRPSKARFESSSLWEDLSPTEWLYRKIDQNLWMAIESWLVSRQLTDMAGPWDESLKRDNDGEYFTRIISCSHGLIFKPDSLCYIRRSTTGISNDMTLNNKKLDSLASSLAFYITLLLRLENSPRTREACLKMLNRWSIYFYPEREDLFNEMEKIACSIEGHLSIPQVRHRYRLIQKTLGPRTAKKTQRLVSNLKTLAKSSLERIH